MCVCVCVCVSVPVCACLSVYLWKDPIFTTFSIHCIPLTITAPSFSMLYLLRFSLSLLGPTPKDWATSEPEPQLKKKRPQPNGSHANKCSIGHVFVYLLVVVSLCLVGGVVFWIYSSSAPGQSALNQGEGKVAVLYEMFDGRLARMGSV